MPDKAYRHDPLFCLVFPIVQAFQSRAELKTFRTFEIHAMLAQIASGLFVIPIEFTHENRGHFTMKIEQCCLSIRLIRAAESGCMQQF
ncbi:hypothetical protein [Phyllobacterium myrsinacearum]|uniref:hypothetical protein n=1 Tax=Phyllobacterium myrsinacearum TaxID=28101 RepID=UPI001FE08DC4|nr:hypothetical protein [Phyllobacterium myrsinacearum]